MDAEEGRVLGSLARECVMASLKLNYQTVTELMSDSAPPDRALTLWVLRQMLGRGYVERSSAQSHWRFTRLGHILSKGLLAKIDMDGSVHGKRSYLNDLTWVGPNRISDADTVEISQGKPAGNEVEIVRNDVATTRHWYDERRRLWVVVEHPDEDLALCVAHVDDDQT